MNRQQTLYLCPTCFEVSESAPQAHTHRMIQIEPAALDAELRRPPTDAAGRLQSRAPLWFLQARRQEKQAGGFQ